MMGFLERRRLIHRTEGFIARGLELLDAGAPFPGDEEAALEYLAPPGRYRDLDLTVDLERIDRIARARGVETSHIMRAALRLGRMKAS
jgi:hypothetical protein